MGQADPTNPWPRMQKIVSSVVMGLHGGRFIEETLESLCVQIGATSAWSTLETTGSGGPMHRSRTASLQGVSPAVAARHITDMLGAIQTQPKTLGGELLYATGGSFLAVPLWSKPADSPRGRTLVGAMYVEFNDARGTQEEVRASSSAWARSSEASSLSSP